MRTCWDYVRWLQKGSQMRTSLTDQEVSKRLEEIPLFSRLKQKHLKLVAQQSKTVSFESGASICTEGESGVGMHVIAEGQVKISVGGREIRQMGPGAFFGEVALLDGGPRSATVVAESDVVTVSIPFWNFRNLLNEHPEIAVAMLEEAAKRLRRTEEGPS